MRISGRIWECRMSDFEGLRVLITGGASGFGFECVKVLLNSGASVAICDVNEAQLKKAEAVLKDSCLAAARGSGEQSRTAGRVVAVQMDVSSSASVRQGVEKCAATFNGLDGLVNCAGIIKVTPL